MLKMAFNCASMEQMETAQRLAGRFFGVSGVPFWGKLKAPIADPRLDKPDNLTAKRLGEGGGGAH